MQIKSKMVPVFKSVILKSFKRPPSKSIDVITDKYQGYMEKIIKKKEKVYLIS